MSNRATDPLAGPGPQPSDLFEIQLAGLQEAANPMAIVSRNGTILWVNRAFEDLTGYSAVEAVGKDTRLLRSGQHSKAFYTELWNTILSGNKWRGELVNRRKDGTLYHEGMTITPLRNAPGEITHFLAIKFDITEHQYYNTINHLLAQAVEHSPELIGIADQDGFLTFANSSFRKALGLTDETLVGRHFGSLLSPNNPPELNQTIAAESFTGGWRGECLVPRSDGTDFPVYMSSSAIKDQEGRVLGVIGIAQEIEQLEKQPFDLILMDVQMPQMDGLEATAAIRQREKPSGVHVPIVALTAGAIKGDEERCLAGGMDAYLSKPINVQKLFSVIQKLSSSVKKRA